MNHSVPHIYLLTLGHFAIDWIQGAIPALLPYFITTCGLNYQDAGTVVFANLLIASVCQPVFGYYADRVSLPWLAPLGMMLSGVSIAVLPFIIDYWSIFLCSMCCGLGSALFHPEAARLVNHVAVSNKGKAMGTFSVGGNAGFAAGPLVAGFCAYVAGIHGLLIFGLFNALCAFWLYHSLTERRQANTLQQAGRPAAMKEEARNDWPSFGKLSVLILARSVCFSTCNAFIPLYWIYILHTSPTTGSWALTILFTLGALITYGGGILADRLGYVQVLRISFCLMVPAMLALFNTTSAGIAMLLLLPVAFSLFAPYSASVILGQTYLRKNIGFASGITLGLSTTFGGLAMPLIGRAADQFGIATALQVLWIMAIIGAAASFLLRSPKSAD